MLNIGFKRVGKCITHTVSVYSSTVYYKIYFRPVGERTLTLLSTPPLSGSSTAAL